MTKNIGVDAAKLAGLQIDQNHKLRNGQMTIEHLEWFNNLTKYQRDLFLKQWANTFYPNEFFQTRKGLWVSSDFKKYILSVARHTKEKTKTISSLFIDLEKPMTNTEIRAKLPENHVFDTDEFCLYLADKIRKQQRGEKGEFLSNRKGNLHFVYGKDLVVFVVSVGWCVDARQWLVNAYELDDYQWDAGYRAFSCN